jgi:hypothetical protein
MLGGCGATEPNRNPIAFTFHQSFAGAATVFSIRNTGNAVVYLPRCGDHVLPEIERRAEAGWVNAAAAVCPATFRMDPILLEVSAVRTDSVTVIAPGTYRLRLGLSRGSPSSPAESVASPSFMIE